MKRMLLLCVIFLFLFFPAASSAQERMTLAQRIVRHRDFLVRLSGYDDCLLSDLEVLENGNIGVMLLSAERFEQHFVFDAQTVRLLYSTARILNETDGESLLGSSIKMTEVKKLAKAARNRAAELRKIWPLREGKPGDLIPQSPPAGKRTR